MTPKQLDKDFKKSFEILQREARACSQGCLSLSIEQARAGYQSQQRIRQHQPEVSGAGTCGEPGLSQPPPPMEVDFP